MGEMENGKLVQRQKRKKKKKREIFRLSLVLLRLPRSQLISHQVLSGPSALKQPFTHTIRLKTTLSSGIVSVYLCKTTGVSLQFAYISIASTLIFVTP